MSEIAEKRREIAELIALELGFGDLETLSATERAAVDRQTQETIAGCEADSPEPADCAEANIRLRGLLQQYRALQILRSDEADARLADEGEVFGREDDA